MGLFGNDRSNMQTMFSMEQRITNIERGRNPGIECLKESLNIAHDMNRQLSDELRALYDYLGIERKQLSGITFVKKGKD